jgi:O-antigen/teichoic acid export membrane protein
VYTRVLAPAEYGAIDILNIFGNLVALTVALEITQAVARFLPDADSLAERRRLVSTAALFSLGAYSLFLAAALVWSGELRALTVGDAVPPEVMVVALVSIWATGIFQMAQNVLRFTLQPRAYTVSSLAFSLVSIVVSVSLVVLFDAGVLGVMTGQLVGGLVGTTVAVWYGRTMYLPFISWERLIRMLRFSAPLVPASLGVFVMMYIDRIALNEMTTLASVGIFGVAYRIASIVSLLMIGFQLALTPLIYDRYRDPSTPVELARVFRLFVAGASMLGMSLSVWAPELLRIATTPEYYEAAVVVPLLAPALLLASMYVFLPGLAIAKRTRLIGLITIGGAVINTGLNLALIPVMGVRGAALATLMSAGLVLAAHVVASQRHYHVPHRWRSLGAAGMGYVVLVAAGVAVGHGTAVSIVVKVVLTACLAAVVIVAGLITPPELERVRNHVTRLARGRG